MYQNVEYILTKNSELLYRDQFCQSSFTKYYSRYLELTRITFGIIDALYLEELIEACTVRSRPGNYLKKLRSPA